MRDAALARARVLTASLIASPLVLAVVALALDVGGGSEGLVMPAVLAGLVALPIGWRLYAHLLERARQREGEQARIDGFVMAIVASLAVTEATALFGVVAHMISRDPFPLIAVAMHVILGGLLWPSRERLDAFLDEPATS